MFRAPVATLLALLAALLPGAALAQSCQDFGSQVLEIEGVGAARFGALEYDSAADAAVLSGGVCILAAPEAGGGWRIIAATMEVEGLRAEPRFRLSGASLELPDWHVYAEAIESLDSGLALQELSFKSRHVQGTAASGRFDPVSGDLHLEQVEARAKGFRVRGKEAALEGERLLFRDAEITTCVCEGGALYLVAAPEASLDLVRERIVLQGGVLRVGSVEVTLAPELELSQDALEDLRFPLVVSDSATTGLTVRTRPLAVADNVGLELGLTRLDETRLGGIFLLSADRPDLSLDFGLAAQGFQADLRRTQPLTDWLDFAFGIRNRHWAQADYLHEGYLALEAEEELSGAFAGDNLDVAASVMAATSSQQLGARHVASPRLNVQARATYSLPSTYLGAFGLGLRGSYTSYPSYKTSQYGLGLTPTWKVQAGPVALSLRYDYMLTDSGSPFGTSLDRLTPQSRLSAQAGLSGDIAAGATGKIGAAVRYDLLADGSRSSPLETASFSASAAFHLGHGSLEPSFQLELAKLLTPSNDPEAKAFAKGELDYRASYIEAGIYGYYDLAASSLDALELSAALPIALPPLTLRPFVAVDFAGVVTGTGPLGLAGHGLELTVTGCCGTLTIGYKLHRGELSTTLSVELPDPGPAQDRK